MYIREAHPTDGRQVPINVRENILIQDPRTIEERQKVARDFAAQFKFTLPLLVDNLTDQAEKVFAAWPDRIYILDAEGKVAYKGGPGPRGFDVAEAKATLDRVLEATAGLSPAQRRLLTERLTMLAVPPAEAEAILAAADRRQRSRTALAALRSRLARETDPAALRAAIERLLTAQREHTTLLDQLDAALEKQVGFVARPQLHALLLSLGVLGSDIPTSGP